MGRTATNDVTLGLALVLALTTAVASFDRIRLEQAALGFVSAHGYAEAVAQGVDAEAFATPMEDGGVEL
jgi:hypothetical protein